VSLWHLLVRLPTRGALRPSWLCARCAGGRRWPRRMRIALPLSCAGNQAPGAALDVAADTRGRSTSRRPPRARRRGSGPRGHARSRRLCARHKHQPTAFVNAPPIATHRGARVGARTVSSRRAHVRLKPRRFGLPTSGHASRTSSHSVSAILAQADHRGASVRHGHRELNGNTRIQVHQAD